MGSVNKAILVGNLGRDAELRFTAGGTPVASFSMATTESWTGKDGQKKEDTQWHKINLWGKVAESLHEYLRKGKQVYIEGRIETKEWTNKDGAKVKSTEIRADKVVLLGGPGGGGSRRDDRESGDDDLGFGSSGPNAPHGEQGAPDDIPF